MLTLYTNTEIQSNTHRPKPGKERETQLRNNRSARRSLVGFLTALILAPLFIALAPAAHADNSKQFGRNNFCRASGHDNTVICEWNDDDDDDNDGDKSEVFIVIIKVIDKIDIDKVLSLHLVIHSIVKDSVKICTVNQSSGASCAGLIVVNVSNVLNNNNIGVVNICACKDKQWSCKS